MLAVRAAGVSFHRRLISVDALSSLGNLCLLYKFSFLIVLQQNKLKNQYEILGFPLLYTANARSIAP